MKKRILIVEDEQTILMSLRDDLELEGYVVKTASDGESALGLAGKEEFDLIILDIMLPGMDGFEVCRRVRQGDLRTPILILTARGQEVDRVVGLELGADDYVTKPFGRRELMARVKALLRRAEVSTVEGEGPTRYRIGNVEIDFQRYEARRGDESVDLTPKEFRLLRYLIQRKDQVVRRLDLLDAVWGEGVFVTPRTVDTHIANLRKKIEDDPSRPRYLVSVRRVGYKFVD